MKEFCYLFNSFNTGAGNVIYSDNQKTMEYEDDIKALLKCI